MLSSSPPSEKGLTYNLRAVTRAAEVTSAGSAEEGSAALTLLRSDRLYTSIYPRMFSSLPPLVPVMPIEDASHCIVCTKG